MGVGDRISYYVKIGNQLCNLVLLLILVSLSCNGKVQTSKVLPSKEINNRSTGR